MARIYEGVQPFTPYLADTYTDGSDLDNTQECAVYGDYLYASSNLSDCITVIDISDPENLSWHSSVSSATYLNGARGLVIDYPYLYIACQISDNVAVYDISSVTPSFVSSITNASLNGVSFITKIGDTIVAASNSTVVSVDVSNVASLSILDTYSDATTSSIWGLSSDTDNELLFIARSSASNDFTILDLSNPSSISYIDEVSATNVSTTSILYRNGHCYVARNVIDTSAPSIVNSLPYTDARSYCIDDVSGHYMGMGTSSFFVYNINNPLAVVPVGTYPIANISNTVSCVVKGDYVFGTRFSTDSIISIRFK